MRRRTRVEPTARGEGRIAVSVVVDALLRSGVGSTRYLEIVRRGDLDAAGRATKFNSTQGALQALQGRDLPGGLPEIEGDVTWRRRDRRWSLDVTHGLISPGVHWWEAVAKGTGDARIGLDGVTLPEAVLGRMEGGVLADYLDHPLLADRRITIRKAVCYAPTRFNNRETPGSLQITLDVPRVEYPD